VTDRLDEQTVAVDTPEAPVSLVDGETIDEDHAVADLAGDAHAGRAGAVDDDALVRERRLGDADGGHEGREGDGTGALDVVVKAGNVVGVLVEQPLGVCEAKVLEVDERVGEELLAVVDELVDEVVVELATYARALPTEVERVREEGVVVGADVEDDGQDPVRVDARAERVKRRLRG